MKKISILTTMLVVIAFGVFAISSKVNANGAELDGQKHTWIEISSNSDLPFYDFSCYGCMEKNGLLIDGSLQYTADMIDESESKIILRGNARVYDLNDADHPEDDESIETDEIIITLID